MKLSSLTAMLLAATLANAQDSAPPWLKVMQQADTDGDGRISMDEVKEYAHGTDNPGFQAFMADHFVEFDKDNDTMVDQDEMRAGIARLGISDTELAKGFAQGFRFISAH
ncbi:MAG: hypothetical protein U1F34_03055 [Gammaproteobacteria bacterium]